MKEIESHEIELAVNVNAVFIFLSKILRNFVFPLRKERENITQTQKSAIEQ